MAHLPYTFPHGGLIYYRTWKIARRRFYAMRKTSKISEYPFGETSNTPSHIVGLFIIELVRSRVAVFTCGANVALPNNHSEQHPTHSPAWRAYLSYHLDDCASTFSRDAQNYLTSEYSYGVTSNTPAQTSGVPMLELGRLFVNVFT